MSASMAEVLAEVLGEVWDDGNCTGLDGWIGPGRGAEYVDSDALYARERVLKKAAEQLAAAGFGNLTWTMTDAEFKAKLEKERIEAAAAVANAVRNPLIAIVNALEFTATGGRDGG